MRSEGAIANAENNNGMDVDKLVVTTAVANPGPILKRGRATARGRYSRILKRTTHITIGVSEKASLSSSTFSALARRPGSSSH